MTDAPDPESKAATLADVVASRAARIVSDRLEARAEARDRRMVPALPFVPTTSPSPGVLGPGVPAHATLAADAPRSDLEGLAEMATEQSPTPDRAIGPRSLDPAPGPISVPPPGDFASAGPVVGPIGSIEPTTRPPGRPADLPGSAPTIATGDGMAAPAILPVSAGGDEISPAARDNKIAVGTPGVRGRLPAAMANLTLTSVSPPARGPAGVAGESRGGADDGAGFDSMMDSARDAAGGATQDLAQTNDLLQQILDAIRKQGTTASAPLPTGGPLVYAERI